MISAFENTPFLVLPCDMPGLVPQALLNLLAGHEPRFEVTAFSIGSDVQPFPGVYEPSLFEAVRNRLEQNRLSMQGLLDLASNKKIMPWKGPQEIFSNINRQSDLTPLRNHL